RGPPRDQGLVLGHVDRLAGGARLQRAHRRPFQERGVPARARRRRLRAHAERRSAVPGRAHDRELAVPAQQRDPNQILVVGARQTPFSDVYHHVLRAPWWLDLLALSGLFLLLNLVFAFAYLAGGGVEAARRGSGAGRSAGAVRSNRFRDRRPGGDLSPALSRSWNLLHRSDDSSPLHGATPETFARDQVELMVTVVGIDETSAQSLHGRHTYLDEQVRWGARHADMVSELPDGSLQLDMREFHRVLPTAPTSTFPYPR